MAMDPDVEHVPTLRQYKDQRAREIADYHDVTLKEVNEEYPLHWYEQEYRDFAVRNFTGITRAVWRTLDEDLKYRIMRSPAALRVNYRGPQN